MKRFFRTVMLLALTVFFSQDIHAGKNDPEIKLTADLQTISDSSYSIEYRVSISGIEASDFSGQEIYAPFEASVIEGMVIEERLNEKDFLYSERDLDLNLDSDTEDSFPFSYRSGTILISGSKFSPVFMKKNRNSLIIPFDSKGVENTARVSVKGHPFSIHSYDPLLGRIKAGVPGRADESIFRVFPNSLLMVEIVKNSDSDRNSVTVNGLKPDTGTTNEREFSPGGETLTRHFTGISINLDKNSASGIIRIENIQGTFKVRVRYLFSISRRIVFMDEKIIQPVKK